MDEAKHHSPILSAFEALVVQCVVRNWHGEGLGPFWWPVPAAGLVVFSASHQFAERILRHNGFARIQKAVLDQTSSRPPNSGHDLFLVQIWLWEVLWSFFLVQPLSWLSLSYKFHFSSHVAIWSRNGSLFLHRIREDDTSKRWFFFFFCDQLTRHSLIELFHLLVCFKCRTTVEWLTLSSSATSCVVVRGSAWMMTLNWS